jgi:membrane protease subunit HflC
MKRNPVTLIVGLLLILVFASLLFTFQVRTTEVVVVTTFGKATRPETEPGLKWKWPWPIQQVHRFDKRVRNFESPFEQVLTSDGFTLLLSVYAGWTISDPMIYLERFGESPRKAEESLEGLVRNASTVVGKHPFAHFVSTDPNEIKFIDIEREMLASVQERLRTNSYGVEVSFLGIKQIGLPESVTKLVFERMESERNVKVAEIESDGRNKAAQIRSAADLASAKLLAQADARALSIRGEAEKVAAKSFEVFKQEPELAIFLLKLRALESFLKERSTLILDQSTPPVDLLKNPSLMPPK